MKKCVHITRVSPQSLLKPLKLVFTLKTDVALISLHCPIWHTVKYSAEDNMHIFKGSENALSLTREFNVEWNCDYAYHWYPFDSQICRMEILSSKSSTELQPTLLQHNPNISLSRYTLRRIRMCKTVFEDMPGIIIELTLGRPIVNNLLTVFVPTMLLVTISFAARCFATDYIDMVIQVNLTILLVLATM